jgi:uncharacterized protein YeaO (DUF488 family)
LVAAIDLNRHGRSVNGRYLNSRQSNFIMSKLKLSTFQIGTPARRGQGLRIGATRFPPRGVPRRRWKSDAYFDVWLPTIAPSRKLLSWVRQREINDSTVRDQFFVRYERELLGDSTARQTLELLAEIAKHTPISIGCFCEDESRCHRLRLYRVIERIAKIK